MNSFVVILSCLAAITAAIPTNNDVIVEYLANGRTRCRSNCQSTNPLADCPPVNCPPAVRDGQCGAPDCSLPGNRLRLHPHPDPNFFWQCVPNPARPTGPFVAQRRPCACGTLFSAIVDELRCVHDFEWERDCPNQPAEPVLSREFCREECPDCDGGSPPATNPPPTVEETLPPPAPTPSPPAPTPSPPAPTPSPPGPTPPAPGPNPPPGENCPCVCFPCIWWPCQPCANNCPCNQQQQQQPRPW